MNNLSLDYIERLTQVLRIPSFFMQEYQMIDYLCLELSQIPGVKASYDRWGNVYAVKGESEHYPFVCAHTDTVHHLGSYNVHSFQSQHGDALKALTDDLKPCGIGGDNKTGIFVCLELLRQREVLKAAFFVGEEYGCHGAVLADPEFFKDIAYGLEFDAPYDYWISKKVAGVKLFDPHGAFWKKVSEVMTTFSKGLTDPYQNSHPYTDMYPIKCFYDFSCLNFSSGYYQMHSVDEYVVPDHVWKAQQTANELMDVLGLIKYPFVVTHNSMLQEHQVKIRMDMIHRFLKFPELNVGFRSGAITALNNIGLLV